MTAVDSIWQKEGEEWKKRNKPKQNLQPLYDLIHPVNEKMFGYKPAVPDGITATWELQTTHAGRFLTIADSKLKVGTKIDQNMPSHKHSLGAAAALFGFSWDSTVGNKLVFKSAGKMSDWTGEESSVYEMGNLKSWGNSRSGRMTGSSASKLAGNTDNSSTISSGSKLRPDGLLIGEWMRVS